MKFEELNLNPRILQAVDEMGFVEATPIQEKCIPLLNQGKDLIGLSLTGSGKTAAFGLPILNKIVAGQKMQALILTPTRELAQQIKENMDKMGKYINIRTVSVYGGVGFDYQMRNLPISEIIVATPGRLLDHVERGTVNLSRIKFVVLDEADRMLDMGFERDVNKIMQLVPAHRQTIMFSATMPPAAKRIAQNYMNKPEHVQEKMHVDTSLLKQIFYTVPRERKFSLLLHLLKEKKGTAIVFCRTKRETDRVSKNLRRQGLETAAIHGDIPQNKRQYALSLFKEGKLDALVATDVAARGIDIKDVSHIYNFNVPADPDDYTHRIGRTARAGKSGEAITLVSEGEGNDFQQILRRTKIMQEPTPDFEHVVLEKRDHGAGEFFGRNEDRRESFGRGRFAGGRGFGGRERGGFGRRNSRRGFGENNYSGERGRGNFGRPSHPRAGDYESQVPKDSEDLQSYGGEHRGYSRPRRFEKRSKPFHSFGKNPNRREFSKKSSDYGTNDYGETARAPYHRHREEKPSFGEERQSPRQEHRPHNPFGKKKFGKKKNFHSSFGRKTNKDF